MKIQQKWFCLFVILMVTACSPATTDVVEEEATSTPASTPISIPTMTEIEIDGNVDDWVDRPALVDDPAGDSEDSYLDFTTGYAFVNEDALYLLLSFTDPGALFVQLDFEMRTDSQRQMFTWTSNGELSQPFPHSKFVLGSAFEARIDLRDLGSPDSVHISQIRVMIGDCCNYPAWHAADEWNLPLGAIEVVNEYDAPLQETVDTVVSEGETTQIVVDGQGDDWTNYPVIVADSAGDQLPFSADLAELCAFRNDEYLYMQVSFYEEGFLGHLIFTVVGEDGNGHQLNIFPGYVAQYARQSGGAFEPISVQSRRSDVVEIKIPLDEFGFIPESIRSVESCCVENDERMDRMGGGAIAVSSATEPVDALLPARTERPVHFRLEYSTMSGDYLYRSFIQLPWGIEVGLDDQLYVADWNGRHIVRLSPDGVKDLGFWQNPTLFTMTGPQDIAFDAQGTMYFSDGQFIYRALEDGEAEKISGVVGWPEAIAFGPDGALYYCDQGGNVYRLEIGGSVDSIAQLYTPRGIAVSDDGMVYVTRWPAGDIVRIDTNSGAVDDFQMGACNFDPCFLAIDPEGDIWVRGIFDLRQFSPDGAEKPYSIIAEGQIIPGNEYRWHTSAGIAFDSQGNMWIASYNSRVQRLELTNPEGGDPIFELLPASIGFEASDLDVVPDGSVYATDLNGRQLLRVSPEGEAAPAVEHGSAGREAVAVGSDGVVYYTAFGEIYRLEADGSTAHYASVQAQRMVVGNDGYLYATQIGNDGQCSIVRITGVDQVETVATGFDGDAFGGTEVFLMHGPGSDLLVIVQASGNLYQMTLEGEAELIGSAGNVSVASASPTTGIVYFISGPPQAYMLKSIDLEGNIRILGGGFVGDPWGMAVSPDGQHLYIAESGAIDRIYLGE